MSLKEELEELINEYKNTVTYIQNSNFDKEGRESQIFLKTMVKTLKYVILNLEECIDEMGATKK